MNPLLDKLSPVKKMNLITDIVSAIKKGNANQIALDMMKKNPEFRDFYEKNKDKPIKQVANEYGVNIDHIKKILK